MGTTFSFMGTPKVSITIPSVNISNSTLDQLLNDSEFNIMATALMNVFENIKVHIYKDDNYLVILIPEMEFHRPHSQNGELLSHVFKEPHGLRYDRIRNEYCVIYKQKEDVNKDVDKEREKENDQYWIHEEKEYFDDIKTYSVNSTIWVNSDALVATKRIMRIYQTRLGEQSFIYDPQSVIRKSHIY